MVSYFICNRLVQLKISKSNRGTIWTRPGLEPKLRSLLCLGMLSALGKQTELASHVKGALNNGLTEEELKYVVYCPLFI